jgi:hypothetical protein
MPRFAGATEARGCAFRSAAPNPPSGIKTHRRASYADVNHFSGTTETSKHLSVVRGDRRLHVGSTGRKARGPATPLLKPGRPPARSVESTTAAATGGPLTFAARC